MLKSIVTVQCIDVDVYVQSIVLVGRFIEFIIAPDKDWGLLGIYPPLFDLIGYFKF